ncbi:MAG: hypothetical protein K9M45_11265 [Kiritimatiellales bacterium]|nr:hypothetical protein [Kiritimatiellales bacterium]
MRTVFFVFLMISATSFSAPSEREIDVRDFGAKMDGATDDTVAFQRALDALPDGGVLKIPAGQAVLSKELMLKNKTAVLRGAGSGVTRLVWTNAGGLHLLETRTWTESKARKASFSVHGIAFTTRVENGGTALFADFTSSDRLDPSFSVQDCRFEGVGAKACWTQSIHGHNAHIGRITQCNFRGASSTTKAHIHLTGNSTCFIIDSCHGMNSTYGVLVEGTTEGVAISNCFFVHNAYGFVLNIAEGGEPMFNVMNSHAASGIYPVWIKNGRSSSLVGNCLILSQCSKYKDGPKSREGIRIEGKLAKDIVVSACTIQITDKDFSDTFTGIHAMACNGLILANNTVANNSGTKDDNGLVLEREVHQGVCSGNVFHLRSSRNMVDRSTAARKRR